MTTRNRNTVTDLGVNLKVGPTRFNVGGDAEMDLGSKDDGFINFKADADGDATSAISTLTTSGSTTHHIQVEINGVTAWIAASTTDPS